MFYKLESLRGIAALLVVLYHSPYHFDTSSTLFIHNSYLFVDLFFILSGFVMSYAYGDRIGRNITFGDYLILRLGRMYPLHLISLLLMLAYFCLKSVLFHWEVAGGGALLSSDGQISSFIGNLLLLQSVGIFDHLTWNTPSWSVSAEILTYVVFFATTFFIDRHKSLWLPPLIAFSCYLFLFTLGRDNLDITYDFGFVRCIAAFYLGVGINRLRRFESLTKKIAQRIELLEWLTVIGIVIAIFNAEVYPAMWIGVVTTFTLAIIVFSSDHNGTLGRLLLAQVLQLSGRWSYSIYMLHLLIILLLSNLFGNTYQGWSAIALNSTIVAITVVVSAMSFEKIEKPWRDRAKRLIANRPPS
ncbi:acyltransferase family protein [Ferrimonas lipolytica]|uniref:Acyltransferase n=1 Tax=Ferrimonas lipolytica TaxID=2724191 RepID=A0A6H1UJF4_9GAMM|nr:acyltransferase [Ferrimonas lipolytica]QIZ78443.1 acyltransferase [Ferrimonas lipolytica]